ncbi:MAG TPA: DNA-processing protein DprA [Sphingomicrobium sp.]|nr:DNA-processing protein DprA [Sphingomicrobium sp.]
MSSDLLDRLQLIRTPSIGPIAIRQLLLRFGSASAALSAIPDLARRGGGKSPAIFPRASAEREMAAVEALGARYLSLGQGLYPRALAELENAPPLIVAKGRVELLDRPMVAIVGARNASAAACRFARGLAHDLGREGTTIVSGLARGIDSAVHDGSLDSGTIAVIAGGIDVVYPPENQARQADISARGLLLAEMPLGTEPRARHFPYRNRIIAGLAAGTVVVEAAPRSGSLITARLAAEAGREVMAVPGSPLDPRAQGCNGLIRDGATLIQNAADVLEALTPIAGRFASRHTPFDYEPAPLEAVHAEAEPDLRAAVESLLGPSPVAVDEIVRQSGALAGASAGAVQLVLLELDLAGRLDRHAGGKVSLALTHHHSAS